MEKTSAGCAFRVKFYEGATMNMLRSIFVWTVFFIASAQTADAQQECSPQKLRDEFAVENCVDAVATFACRTARSMGEMRDCFTKKARQLVGKNYKGAFVPGCTKQNSLTAACSINPGWGAGDEWCYRSDENTVQMCTGDPPRHHCRSVINRLGGNEAHGCLWVKVSF
jgi:hypothetical protein